MARLARIWLGGICCTVPMAWRKNENTMMMRVNEVTHRMMDGARDSTVSPKQDLEQHADLSGCVLPGGQVERQGRVQAVAWAASRPGAGIRPGAVR